VRQHRGWTTPTTTQRPSQRTTQPPFQATTQAIRPANAGLRAMPNKDHNRSLCLVQERLLICEINDTKMGYETVLIILIFKYAWSRRACPFAK